MGGTPKVWDDETKEQVLELIKKAKFSDATRNRVANAICNYIWFRKQGGEEYTPLSLLDEAKTDIEKTMAGLEAYYQWLQGIEVEGYPKNKTPMLITSAKERVFSKCVSFFTHNRISFGRHFTPTIAKESPAIKADRDYEFVKLNEEGNDTVLDKSTLRKFLSALNARDRAIGLCMLSSGQDAGELFSLSVGDFKTGCKMNHTGERFFWENSRSKTHKTFQTFFSVEATEAVKHYLQTERSTVKDDEPLFISKYGGRMQANQLSANYFDTAKRIGIEWNDEKHQNPFRPKRLRHFFSTCLEKAKVGVRFSKIMMGHNLTIGESYVQNRADLEIEYTKVEPLLGVYSGTEQLQKTVDVLVQSQETIATLKQTISDLRYERDTLKDQLTAQRMKNEKTEGEVSVLQTQVTRIFAMLNDPKDKEIYRNLNNVGEQAPLSKEELIKQMGVKDKDQDEMKE